MTDHQQEEPHGESADNDADTDAVPVHLGFSVKIESLEHLEAVAHRSADINQWDGGQIGGLPVWLQPSDIPVGPLQCLNCSSVMSFLCQLYAPVESFENENENNNDVSNDADEQDQEKSHQDRAFHRSLYVFGCSQCADRTIGSIRVLRTQLPENNPFYPLVSEDDNDDEDEDWQKHQPAHWNVKQCAVCGLAGKGKCPLQEKYFCCPQHQKEHKKYVFDQTADQAPYLPSVYNLSELVVEEEPALPTHDPAASNNESETMFPTNDDGEDDSDEDLEQDDLNRMTGSSQTTQDPTTMGFYQRIKERPNCQQQCLRYNRWPKDEAGSSTALWIRQDFQPTAEVIPPPCPYCHAPRKFEFQLMPQLLHYLLEGRKDKHVKTFEADTDADYISIKQAVEHADTLVQQAPPEQIPPALVDAKIAAIKKMQERLVGSGSNEGNKEIDWGVVAVYTCTASCETYETMDPALGAYREEFAWKQPSLDA
jgi:pre-rRNA-processing protein TSR4